MAPDTHGAFAVFGRRSLKGIALVALATSGFLLTGCSVVRATNKVAHDVEGNKATIDTFTNKMSSGTATPFEATYVTTGSSPATIVYAVLPPKGLAFTDTPSGSTSTTGGEINTFRIIVNSSGEYACTPPTSSSGSWQCEKLSARTQQPRTRSSTSTPLRTGKPSSVTSRSLPDSPGTR